MFSTVKKTLSSLKYTNKLHVHNIIYFSYLLTITTSILGTRDPGGGFSLYTSIRGRACNMGCLFHDFGIEMGWSPLPNSPANRYMHGYYSVS